jgi:hypothetical protein
MRPISWASRYLGRWRMRMTKTIAICNQKGGVTKTTTVIEINDLDELKNLINSLPEGTVYSLNLEVVELGQET